MQQLAERNFPETPKCVRENTTSLLACGYQDGLVLNLNIALKMYLYMLRIAEHFFDSVLCKTTLNFLIEVCRLKCNYEFFISDLPCIEKLAVLIAFKEFTALPNTN